MWIRSVREAACSGPPAAPDQESQHQIGALRRTGKQRAAGARGCDRDEQDRILVHQQNGR